MQSHRIPKFLTKPWKTKTGKFKIFSFKENRIYEENANYFFSENNILTQQEEEFWNKNVETPLADFFNKMHKYKLKRIIKVDNWKHIKAMHLLFISIIERSLKNRPRKSLDFNKKDFEAGVWQWHNKNSLLILNSPIELNFPEFGFFPIVFLTRKKMPLAALGIPILGNKVLISFKREINSEDIIEFAKNGEALFTASISNVGDKVIIHPDILEQVSAKIIPQILFMKRKFYSDYLNDCKELSKEINKLYQLGLNPSDFLSP